MKTKDALNLKKNDKILHRRYGESIVKSVKLSRGSLFGIVITPITDQGRYQLALDSDTNIPDFLEGYVGNYKSIN